MRFIGIDLAWTYKNETGVCVINELGEIEYLNSAIFSDEDLLAIIKSCNHEPMCIAIDAPLVVKNEGGSRQAERDFMKEKIHGHNISLFVASRGYLKRTFGQIRGETLMNKIINEISSVKISEYAVENQTTIVETFPSGICLGLFPEIYPVKYKIKRKVDYSETEYQMNRLLERFRFIENKENRIKGLIDKLEIDKMELTKSTHKHIEDKVDAFLSAYGLFSIHKGYAMSRTFGDIDNGFITIPVTQGLDNNYDDKVLKKERTKKIENITNSDIVSLTIRVGELAKLINEDKAIQKKAIINLEEEIRKIKEKC